MAYKIHISCRDIARSKSDMLHRFIAQLTMPSYDINRVLIFEKPIRAVVVFQDASTLPQKTNKFAEFFAKVFQKKNQEFTLHLTIDDRDMTGYNFSLRYSFDELRYDLEGSSNLSEGLHKMMATSFNEFSDITVLADN